VNAATELTLLGLAAATAGGVAWANDYFVFSIILMRWAESRSVTSLQHRDKWSPESNRRLADLFHPLCVAGKGALAISEPHMKTARL
jgi:hypothetical protein